LWGEEFIEGLCCSSPSAAMSPFNNLNPKLISVRQNFIHEDKWATNNKKLLGPPTGE